MPLIENSRLLSTCQRCGKKFEVNTLITHLFLGEFINKISLYCPTCAFNKRAEDFNRSWKNGR